MLNNTNSEQKTQKFWLRTKRWLITPSRSFRNSENGSIQLMTPGKDKKRNWPKTATNWLLSELFKHLKEDGKTIKDITITPENFAELITLVYQDKINSSAGQQILEVMYARGGDPSEIMKDLGLEQMDNSDELEKIVKDILEKNPSQVKEFKNGKEALLQFFVGQTMAATKGKANPKKVGEIVKKLLK